jgi:hypothetical protein
VDPAWLTGEAARVRRAGERIGAVLWLVVGLALIFTATNVTFFAVDHGVSPWIAWLLDPVASLALIAMLLADGVLARHGERAGGWAVVVKFGAGGATWAMNVWSAVAAADAAGMLLHSVPPALVIGLAEATPRCQVRFAELADELDRRASLGGLAGEPSRAPALQASGQDDRTSDLGSSPGSVARSAPPAGDDRPVRSTAQGSRTLDDLRGTLWRAIAEEDLEALPSADAIRRHLAISPGRARALRNEVRTATGGAIRDLARASLVASAAPEDTPS